MIKKERKEYQARKRLPMPKYLFADRLKAEMKKKGYTQYELADMMGVSINTVYDWCQHYTFPSDMNLGQLCIIFAPCSADYFHGTIDAPNYDIKFVMEYTGLSETTIEALHYLSQKHSPPNEISDTDSINKETIKFINFAFDYFMPVIKQDMARPEGKKFPITTIFTDMWGYVHGAEDEYSAEELTTIETSLPTIMTQNELVRFFSKEKVVECLFRMSETFNKKKITIDTNRSAVYERKYK